MGEIYKVTNIITKENYIGATFDSMYQRKIDHIEKAQKGKETKFYHALRENKPDNFKWEVIDVAENSDELARKEQFYINFYDSLKNGYNSDRGGGFKKTVYQFNLSGELIHEFNSLTSAGNAVNASKKTLSRTCYSVNKRFGDYLWSFNKEEPFHTCNDNRKKKVLQGSLNGEPIQMFNSVSEASNALKLNKTSIAKVCRGEKLQYAGYVWTYQNN